MELDQKLGMSLDQLMKSDGDTKKALRSTRLRGRRPARPAGSAKMDISDDKASSGKGRPARTGQRKAVVKKAIAKDVEMRSRGIEKIESRPSSKVVLTSKKAAASLKKKQAEQDSAERRTVKISNIPYDVHWRDVKEAFAKLVPVDRCDVEKGVATIVFKSRSDAQRAIDTYNGGNMNGRIIRAAFA